MLKRNRQGFTIVELLIVIVIIGVLAGLVIVAYNGVQSRASAGATVQALDQAYKAVESYKLANGTHPTSLDQAGLKQSTSTPVGFVYDSNFSQTIPAMSGYPDITIYSVFDIVSSAGNYDALVQLEPVTASQRMQLDTGNSGAAFMRYRIDTSAATNVSSGQWSGPRSPGRHLGWLQVKSGMTVREFAYDKAQAQDSLSLAPGAGWNYTSVRVPAATASTVPVATIVFNKAHDEQTRAAVIAWIGNRFQ